MLVRPAAAADLAALTGIYNHYVENTHVTFDTEPFSDREQWFGQFLERGPHRVFVAEDEGRIAGYASSTRFRHKPAYATSVETTVYLAPDAGRRGFGSALYEALFTALADEDVHRAYAGVALPNPGSVAFHERFGFERIGLYREVGRKFGRYWDVVWYERALP